MEGRWRRTHDATSREEALSAVEAGAEWIFLWCGGREPSRSGENGDDALLYAKGHLVDPDERQRLFAEGERKRRMPTVVMAERWESVDGSPLVLFYEDGPYLLPDRSEPDRL
jgi:hypothetical protein